MSFMASETAQKLKALREGAGLSVAEVARELGKPKSSYQYYEDTYKKDWLPLPFLSAIAPLFDAHGVPADALMQLGGQPASIPSGNALRPITMKKAVSRLGFDAALMRQAIILAMQASEGESPDIVADAAIADYLESAEKKSPRPEDALRERMRTLKEDRQP